jgi:Family of unknown function (DUF6169)
MSILQPYSFSRRDNRYIFHTDNSVTYSVEFTDGSYYFFDLPTHIPVFEFTVGVLNAVDTFIQPYDERTEVTIVHILSAFFEDHKNSLLYVCDNLGNRQQARFRKFHSWFKKNKTDSLEKYDVIFSALEMQILASLIVHVQNPDKDLLVSLFLGLYK